MIRFQVNDMTCGHCAATITKAVKALDAAAQIDIDLTAHLVQIESAKLPQQIEAAIRDAGFSPHSAA